MIHIRNFPVFALLTLLVVASACASGPKRTAGYLRDYTKLTRSKTDKGDWIWEKPGVDMRTYDRLLIKPVVVMPDSKSTVGEFSPEKLKKAAKIFHKMLVDTVDPYYTCTRDSGVGVLQINIAITDMVPASDTREGEAAIEFEMLDSMTGEELATGVLRTKGSLSGPGDVPEEWRHVEGAFADWAQGLLDYMDRNHVSEELVDFDAGPY